jgi:hypothetical protein
MHTDSEVETFDNEDLETNYWFNKLVPKEIKEKEFRVVRRRPKNNYED